MTKSLLGALFLGLMAMPVDLVAQNAPSVSPTPTPAQKSNKKPTTSKPTASTSDKPEGLDLNAGITGPITTEIFADEAFFDSTKSEGIFRGRVKVNDPRFNLQADKLTVFISKSVTQAQTQTQTQTQNQGQSQGPNQGLEKAIAEGNVAVVRERPDPNGGPPSRAVGRADTAVYTASTGNVELKGSPRVQQGLNTHIGTSPDTVMTINQSGQLTTHGPSRTDIRQEPKDVNNDNKDKKDNKGGGGKDEKKTPQSSPKP